MALIDSYHTACNPFFFFVQGYEPLSGKHEVVYRGDDPWEVRQEGGVLFVCLFFCLGGCPLNGGCAVAVYLERIG